MNSIKDWRDYLDKLVRERLREFLTQAFLTWGVPVVIGQVVSLLRGMDDNNARLLAKGIEKELDLYNSRLKD